MAYLERLRAAVGDERVIIVYTTAVIRDRAGRFLLHKRTDFNDGWGPPGGILEPGETLVECARREAREETGLTVRVVHLVGLHSGPEWDIDYPNGDRSQQWSAIFECRVDGPAGALDLATLTSRADRDEIRDLAWFTPEALTTDVIKRPWYRALLADVVAGKPAATFERPRSGQPPSDGGYILDLRRRFGPGLLITPGSGAIVRNDGGKILLIQRSDNGQWAYPGGYVDVGESAAEAAVREAYEEAGVVVEVKRLVGAYTGPDHQVTYANGDQAQFASAVFDCQWQSGEPRTDGVETVTVGWFPPDPSAWPNPMNKRVRRRLLEALSARPEAYFQ